MSKIIKKRNFRFISAVLCLCGLIFLASCNQLDNPKPEPFYAQTAPPQKKEFRWSNGKTPKSFDPALASAPPETDVVRAVFEGLTDTDSKTLKTIPAIATDWKASSDFKVWTFNLRRDAKWSNGERVTAMDFVRSWKRLAEMGGRVSHPELLRNIVGLKISDAGISPGDASEKLDVLAQPPVTQSLPFLQNRSNTNSAVVPPSPNESNANTTQKSNVEKKPEPLFGIEAVDNFTLKVSLIRSDKDFPALVAHPIFRPVYGGGANFDAGKLNADIVTNGAFRIFSVGQDGITLDRAENYWDRKSVELERVRFVPTESAEKALEAYRAGEIDAVTNADFEPLALKLLTPFEDFRRTTYAAINFYEFNRNKPPFNDRRVREALAIAIERERITEDAMDGASEPAFNFTPFGNDKSKLPQDSERAQNLLTESGFPDGADFPVIKLLVNRNNLQQRVARSVAKMWKQNLNIETEIIIKNPDEFKAALASEDYSLARRGALLPTTSEAANLSMIFASQSKSQPESVENKPKENNINSLQNGNPTPTASVITGDKTESETPPDENTNETSISNAPETGEEITTEAQAISELPAIPLYFPTSYSLVKPYIQGFEMNILDAPSLKNVRIDNNWQPKTAKSES